MYKKLIQFLTNQSGFSSPSQALGRMGVVKLFGDTADLTFTDVPLYPNALRHLATITVDEKGTVASAVTGKKIHLHILTCSVHR